jgi:hypothetical protein
MGIIDTNTKGKTELTRQRTPQGQVKTSGKTDQAGIIFVSRVSPLNVSPTTKSAAGIIVVNGRNLKRVTSARVIGRNQPPKNAAILSANDGQIKLRAPSDMQEGSYQIQFYAGNEPVQVAQQISTFQVKTQSSPAAPPPPAPRPMIQSQGEKQTSAMKIASVSAQKKAESTETVQSTTQSGIMTQEVLSSGTSVSKTLGKTTGDISKAESVVARMEQMEEISSKLGVGKELEEPEGGVFGTKGLKTDSGLLDIAQKGSSTTRPGGEDIPSTESLFSPDTGGGGNERSSSLDFSTESIGSSGYRGDSRLMEGETKEGETKEGEDSSSSSSDSSSSSSDSSSSSSSDSSDSSSGTTTVTQSDTDDSSSDGSSETSSTNTKEGSDGSSSTHTVTQITDSSGNTTTEQFAWSTNSDGETTYDYSCNGNLCNPDPDKVECVSKGCEEFMKWVYAMGLVRNQDILNPQGTLADPGGEEFGTTTRRGLKVIDSQKVMQEKLNPYINPDPDSTSGDSDIAAPSTGHSVPQTDLVDTLPDPDQPGTGTGRMGPEPLPGQ